VGIAGARGLEDEFMRLAERQTVAKRRVRVVRVRSARDCAPCHVTYPHARSDA
jgi:hypothetical protein